VDYWSVQCSEKLHLDTRR